MSTATDADAGQDTADKLLEGQDILPSEGGDTQDSSPAQAVAEQAAESGTQTDQPPESTETVSGTSETTETESGRSTFLDEVAAAGFENVESESDAQVRLIEAYRQREDDLQRHREELERQAQVIQLIQAQRSVQQQAPAETETDKPESWWNPPPIDLAMVQQYRDPANESGWRSNTPQTLIDAAAQLQLYNDEWLYGLSYQPKETLTRAVKGILSENPELMQEIMAPIAKNTFREIRSEQASETFFDDLKRDHADFLYEKDPRTQQFIPGRLTAEAREVMSIAQELERDGIVDPARQWERATEIYRLRLLDTDTAETPSPSEQAKATADQKRKQYLKRAAGSGPGRGGSVTTETQDPQPQNQNLRVGQKLVQELEQDGFDFS